MDDLSRRLAALSPEKRTLLMRTLRQGGVRFNTFPLSFAQQRLWFLHQMEPESSFYTIPMAVRLEGELDVPALRRGLDEIVRRHESLRTTFVAMDGQPAQVVAPSLVLPLAMVDLGALPAPEREREVRRRLAEEIRRPFDLARGPLIRITLFRQDAREHVLLLVVHHIISDGWSEGILFRELSSLYAAYAAGSAGPASPLPVLPIQYADFAAWQRDWLTDGVLEAELGYWRERLREAPEFIELPTDRPRPLIQAFRGAHCRRVFPGRLLEGIAALGRGEGATPFMTLLAAFAALLGRYSGQDDLVIGAPVAGRGRPELAGLIGCFVNALALRVDLSGDPPFRELLARVRAAALGAYAHQELPFERLVEALHPQRSLSQTTPLFRVMFQFHEAPAPALRLPGLVARNLRLEDGAAQFDLSVDLARTGAGLLGTAEYSTDLFEAATAARMLGHLRALLGGVVAAPERRLSRLPLLGAAERRRLLVTWNATATDLGQEYCLHQLVEAQAARTPDAEAAACGGERWTYRELDARANRLAHYLRARGVGPEHLVGICVERPLDAIVGLLAVLKAGGAYVPLDPSYPRDRLALILRDARATALVTQGSLADQLPTGGVTVIRLDAEAIAIERESPRSPSVVVDPAHPAYVIYTSGSTGRPKGVLVPHRASVNHNRATSEAYDLRAGDRVLQFASLSFDVAVEELFATWAAGATIVLPSDAAPAAPAGLMDLVERERISVLNLPASYWHELALELARRLDPWPPSLRLVIAGSERLAIERVRTWHRHAPASVRLLNAYGTTETAVTSALHDVTGPFEGPQARPEVPIGRPIANVQAYVLDAQMRPVPIGVPGELYIGGAGLARGYLGRPALTAERFVPDPFGQGDGARLYRTGDRARRLSDGSLEMLGRVDHQVKLRGYRIELGEIEAQLTGHPGVRDAVVVLRDEDARRPRLVAYVAPERAEDPPAPAELRRHLKERLPDYMVPATFVALERLPLTPNGKLDRRALPAPERAQPGPDDRHAAPRTPAERILAEIWAGVLKLGRVGIHENFFEAGGDSILSIQVIARAHQAGLHLTPKQLFQHQTIAELAAVAGAGDGPRAEQGPVVGPVPLTPIQRWFFEQDFADPHHWNQSVLMEAREALDGDRLEGAIARVLAHHDALRLRFTRDEAGWHQVDASPDGAAPFVRIDLSALAEGDQARAVEDAAGRMQASLDLSGGPLLRVALFDLGVRRGQRLLIIVHHLAVDGVSWRILLEDLQLAYEQLGRGEEVRLPPKTTSFRDWARRLHEYAQSPAIRREAPYWLAAPRARIAGPPVDFPDGSNSEASARTIAVELDAEATQGLLQDVPKAYHSRINDAFLTALAQTFAQWTGSRSLLVEMEGHGREEVVEGVDLSRTVGWFTSAFPVLLELGDTDHPGDNLKAIKEQIRQIPNKGIGYGILRHLGAGSGIPEALRALPQAHISFNYLGQFDQGWSDQGLFRRAREACGPEHSPRASRGCLLDINGLISGGRLRMEWTYSAQMYRRSTVLGLATRFLEMLQALIAHCRSAEAGGYTPSDFPEAGLDQLALDGLIAELRGPAGPNVEAIYPLAPVQQGMLFHTLYAPHSGVYLEQLTYVLHGRLDPELFRRAWQAVVDRHPILRTLFLWQRRDQPLQVVRQRARMPWRCLDWRSLSPAERATRLEEYLQDDRARGFELAQAPLMRLALIRLADDSHRLIWSSHHLLLDGWSTPLVLHEVLAHYDALSQGRKPRLEHTRPYRDYIAWIQRQDLAKAEEFWRRTLDGFTAPTPLGVGRIRGEGPGEEADYESESLHLSAAATGALQAFARQHQLTPNTLAQGAWALLLGRYSGEADVVFGATSSGRPPALAGVESMVGLFINTLPVRVRMAPEETLVSWLKRLQAQQAALRQYEYSPLVQVQGWSEVPRGQPLFESCLVFENYPDDPSWQERASGLTMRGDRAVEWTNYPLTVFAGSAALLELRVTYDAGRFTAPAIRRMLAHLRTLLEGMASDPGRRLADLPLLTSGEERQILREWNATATDLPSAACIHHLVEAQAGRTPATIAVEHGGDRLTYRELNARADRLAHELRALGVGPEVPVGVCLERSPDLAVGLLAILKAGGAYVPLDPAYPPERLAYMLDDSRAPVLLTQRALLERVPACGAEPICLDAPLSAWALRNAESSGGPVDGATSDSLAYIIYTSGSTGRPKGVQIVHRGVLNCLEALRAETGMTDGDVLLSVTTLSFDIATLEVFLPLILGARLVIAGRADAADAAQLSALIASADATVMQATPATWRLLLDAGWRGGERLTILCGGEALAPGLADELRRRCAALWNVYGPTETTIWSTAQRIRDARMPISIGRPLANTQVYLLDAHLRPVPIGVAGELYIGGVGLARGYQGRPDLTAERFIPDPFGADEGGRLYRTGDLARYLPDGRIEHLGRLDHQVKLRGYRIELGEIEATLRHHPAVRDAAVVVREDAPGEKRLVGYVLPRLQREAPGDASAASLASDQVDHWRAVWDATYRERASHADATFNTDGWISSYTGLPIPADEMREWVDHTVRRIRERRPRRVLEVGCGVGLLLFRLAPHCAHYCGVDFSQAALDYIRRQIASGIPGLSHVTLLRRAADDLAGIEAGVFDTVILNSVVQYFPTIDHLVNVLSAAARVVEPGGVIFVGDVRSLPLLEAFHATVELGRAPAEQSLGELQRQIQARVVQEEELVIDPAFFRALPARLPQIGGVQVQLKRGRFHNELTGFRYDVVLHTGPRAAEAPDEVSSWLDWREDQVSLPALRRLLDETRPDARGVARIPNARLASAIRARQYLVGGHERPQHERPQSVGALRQLFEALPPDRGAEPEDLWALGAELGYAVEIDWSGEGGGGCFDATFRKGATRMIAPDGASPARGGGPADVRPLRTYANTPLHGKFVRRLVPELRAFLRERLPDYMAPAEFMALESLPLTPNGKLDRRALPAPERAHVEAHDASIAPRDPIELHLAHIFEGVLDVQSIGVRDNFFALGGHSLSAMRLIARVQARFGQQVPLSALFQGPTIEQLARVLREGAAGPSNAPASPIVAIQPRGARPPFFCVHPGAGGVLSFVPLARRLGMDQPFHGLQARGLFDEGELLTSVKDMAAYYLEAVRGIQPRGPYLLGGWSFGGMVAFEMARQLVAQGQPVALLALLDAPAPAALAQGGGGDAGDDEEGEGEDDDDAATVAWFAAQLLRRFGKELPADQSPALLSAEELRRLAGDERLGYFLAIAKRVNFLPPDAGLTQVRRYVRVSQANGRAMQRYAPRRAYAHPVVLLRADEGATAEGDDPTLGWGGLVSGPISTYVVPGTHDTLVDEPHVVGLADRLRRCIEEVQGHGRGDRSLAVPAPAWAHS